MNSSMLLARSIKRSGPDLESIVFLCFWQFFFHHSLTNGEFCPFKGTDSQFDGNEVFWVGGEVGMGKWSFD